MAANTAMVSLSQIRGVWSILDVHGKRLELKLVAVHWICATVGRSLIYRDSLQFEAAQAVGIMTAVNDG